VKPDQAGKKLAALLKKLGSQYEVEEPPPRDPVAQLIVALLQWRATREAGEEAFGRLMAELVDYNDLRVSHPHELIELIGPDYPLASERVIRLREALHEVFVREYAVSMQSIAGKPKKDQRAYLDTLPGVTPYAAAQVTLLSFGGHALPVDEKLVALLAQQGVLEPQTPPAAAESWLMRQVKADEGLRAYLLLQAWADDQPDPEPALAGAEAGQAGGSAGGGTTGGGGKGGRSRTASRTAKVAASPRRKKTTQKRTTKRASSAATSRTKKKK